MFSISTTSSVHYPSSALARFTQFNSANENSRGQCILKQKGPVKTKTVEQTNNWCSVQCVHQAPLRKLCFTNPCCLLKVPTEGSTCMGRIDPAHECSHQNISYVFPPSLEYQPILPIVNNLQTTFVKVLVFLPKEVTFVCLVSNIDFLLWMSTILFQRRIGVGFYCKASSCFLSFSLVVTFGQKVIGRSKRSFTGKVD